MYKYYLTIGSITKANMASNALKKSGVKHKIIKTPLGIQRQGCGYSIAVVSDPERAAGLIERGGVTITSIQNY